METEEETRARRRRFNELRRVIMDVNDLAEVEGSWERILELVQEEFPKPPRRRWWFIELWDEQRNLFKELVKHIAVFGLLLGTLEGFHWVLERSQLQQARLLLLDKFHFWSSVVLLVIFAISLIIKVALFETGVRK